MILSFISQKGGSGKTTLSVNLAALASSNGVPVAIVDLDPQASASAWCAARGTDDIRHEACHPPLLARTLERLREAGIALIVIDTPPTTARLRRTPSGPRTSWPFPSGRPPSTSRPSLRRSISSDTPTDAPVPFSTPSPPQRAS